MVQDYKRQILTYVLYYKNEELLDACQRDVYDTYLDRYSVTLPSFPFEEKEESLFSQLVNSETERYLDTREPEVKDTLLAYLRTRLEDFASGTAVAKEIKEKGLEETALAIYYFAVDYASMIRTERAGLLVEVGKDGKVYPLEGEERANALQALREYYSPFLDRKEALSIYEPYEREIVLNAPEIITTVDATIARAVRFPGMDYKALLEE